MNENEAYVAGWINAAKWADRLDLIADVGSDAFERDRQAAFQRLSSAPPRQHQEMQAQPAERKPLAAQQLDKAAKALAECMDYPWELMPEQGREQMRKNALAVIAATNGIGDCTCSI